MSLFDSQEAQRLKHEGMDLAASSRLEILALAQQIAREIVEQCGEVTSDDVAEALPLHGVRYEDLGNAAGSIFRHQGFSWTGRMIASRRVPSHGRLIRVWEMAEVAPKAPQKPL